MRKYLRCYWHWIKRFFIKFLAMGVIVLFSHMAKAHDQNSCSQATPKLQINANFGSTIEVSDSAPIGAVLKTVPVNNIELRMKCDTTGHYPPPGYPRDYGQEVLGTEYSLTLGTGASVPGLPGVCATGVPGIGIKLANISNMSLSSSSDVFKMINDLCRMDHQIRGIDGGGIALRYYIHGFNIQIQNGSFDIQLIKTGPPPKNPTNFSVPPLNFYFANDARWGGPGSSGPGWLRDRHWSSPQTGISIMTGPTTIVAKSPSCTFNGPSSRTVNFGSVESSVIQNNNAPYQLVTLLFSCEAGAKLDLAQLQVDGAGVSNDRPGLVNIDNTQAGSAQNVLIELVDAKERRLPFKQNVSMSSLDVISSGDTHNIPFRARLYSDSGKLVKPGSVSASLTFTLAQQ